MQQQGSWTTTHNLIKAGFDEMKVSVLAQLDQRLERLSGPSDYAFLLNIRGLVNDWQVPYFTAMDYTLNKESYQWIIAELYKIDLTVLLTVCDMGMFILIVSCFITLYPNRVFGNYSKSLICNIYSNSR